jgi:hypothetical protein
LKKLFANTFIFGSPLFFFLLFFVIDDPFGILYKSNCLAATSEDMMVIRKYLTQYEIKAPSAFIFGNSRTHAFKQYKCGATTEEFFDFGCPGESVLNIKKKLQLVIDKQKEVKNVLILLDDGILENTDNTHKFYQGPVYNHTPQSSNVSYITFYSNYIKYYFSDFFFIKHVYYRLTGNYKEAWMKDAFAKPGVDINYACKNYPTLADSLLETNFEEYKRVFKPDYVSYPKKEITIDKRDVEHLNQIKQVLESRKINYKIIYPPSFHKRKIEYKVQKFLGTCFAENFYDFSGVNKITTDSTLNYENLHFTYRAANMIMDSICLKVNE